MAVSLQGYTNTSQALTQQLGQIQGQVQSQIATMGVVILVVGIVVLTVGILVRNRAVREQKDRVMAYVIIAVGVLTLISGIVGIVIAASAPSIIGSLVHV